MGLSCYVQVRLNFDFSIRNFSFFSRLVNGKDKSNFLRLNQVLTLVKTGKKSSLKAVNIPDFKFPQLNSIILSHSIFKLSSASKFTAHRIS